MMVNSQISTAADSFLALSSDSLHKDSFQCRLHLDQEMDPVFQGNAVSKKQNSIRFFVHRLEL